MHYVAPEVLKKSTDSQQRNEVCRCVRMCSCTSCKAWIHIQKKWMCGPPGLGSPVRIYLPDCTVVIVSVGNMTEAQVVLFVMLAGTPPFHSDDDVELMKKVKKAFAPHTFCQPTPSHSKGLE